MATGGANPSTFIEKMARRVCGRTSAKKKMANNVKLTNLYWRYSTASGRQSPSVKMDTRKNTRIASWE